VAVGVFGVVDDVHGVYVFRIVHHSARKGQKSNTKIKCGFGKLDTLCIFGIIAQSALDVVICKHRQKERERSYI
jgi:hypothetical protein